MIAAVSEMRSAGACTNGVRCELAALAQMSNTCRSLGACGLLLETRFVLTVTAADWRDAADRRRLGSREASSPRLSNVNRAASGRAVKLCLTARSTAASLNAASVARFASRRRFLRETREDSAIVRVCAVLTVAQNWLDAALPCLPRSSRFASLKLQWWLRSCDCVLVLACVLTELWLDVPIAVNTTATNCRTAQPAQWSSQTEIRPLQSPTIILSCRRAKCGVALTHERLRPKLTLLRSTEARGRNRAVRTLLRH